MKNELGLAVHRGFRPPDDAAGNGADALMSQTHPQDGNFSPEMTDDIVGDTGFQGGTGAGGNDDMTGRHRRNLLQGDTVVAGDHRVPAQLAQVLDEVVGKRIVIINYQNHRRVSTITREERLSA